MARPRKDSNIPGAEQRLQDALLVLLKKHRVHDITVDMLVRQAQCNRGTFYYHYEDIDDILFRVVEQNLLENKLLRDVFFGLTSGSDKARQALDDQELDAIGANLSLFLRQGGGDIVAPRVKKFIAERWDAVLAHAGKSLNERGRMVIEFVIGGVVAALGQRGQAGEPMRLSEEFAKDSFREIQTLAVSRLAQAEGLSRTELLSCLAAVEG